MLVYSTINIGGDSGIKCAVFALEDVEEIHKLTIANLNHLNTEILKRKSMEFIPPLLSRRGGILSAFVGVKSAYSQRLYPFISSNNSPSSLCLGSTVWLCTTQNILGANASINS